MTIAAFCDFLFPRVWSLITSVLHQTAVLSIIVPIIAHCCPPLPALPYIASAVTGENIGIWTKIMMQNGKLDTATKLKTCLAYSAWTSVTVYERKHLKTKKTWPQNKSKSKSKRSHLSWFFAMPGEETDLYTGGCRLVKYSGVAWSRIWTLMEKWLIFSTHIFPPV